jgi:hypothetical protein
VEASTDAHAADCRLAARRAARGVRHGATVPAGRRPSARRSRVRRAGASARDASELRGVEALRVGLDVLVQDVALDAAGDPHRTTPITISTAAMR